MGYYGWGSRWKLFRIISMYMLQMISGGDEDNIFDPNAHFIELTSEDLFIDECSSFLLSKASLQDQKISQVEYAEFLDVVCVEEGSCVDGELLAYDSINNNLQNIFLAAACPDSPNGNPAACFFDFKNMGSEFGIAANPDNIHMVDEWVMGLCSSSYQVILQEGVLGEKLSNRFESVKYEQPQPQTRPTMVPTLAPQTPPVMLPSESTTGPQAALEEPSSFIPTIATEGPSSLEDKHGPYKLSFGAIWVIIAVILVSIFCMGVIYCGKTKHPHYDINHVEPLKSGHFVRTPRNTIYDGNDVFHDEH